MPPNIRSGNPFLSMLMLTIFGAALLAALSLSNISVAPASVGAIIVLGLLTSIFVLIALLAFRPGRRSQGASGTAAGLPMMYANKQTTIGGQDGGAGWRPRLGTSGALASFAGSTTLLVHRLGRAWTEGGRRIRLNFVSLATPPLGRAGAS